MGDESGRTREADLLARSVDEAASLAVRLRASEDRVRELEAALGTGRPRRGPGALARRAARLFVAGPDHR